MKQITVEPMRSADLENVLALWKSTEGLGLDVNDVDSVPRLAEYLARNPGMSFMALDANRAIVGAVLCGHDGRRGYLHHLAVAQGCRKQGVASRLVAACMSELKKAGIAKCNVFVFDHNKDGQEFWEKNGWSRRRDLLVMQRPTA